MNQHHLHLHEKQTLWVVILTALTMAAEITFGLLANSMALLSDGIHMGSHVFALGLSWLTYVFIRRSSKNNIEFDTDRVLSLSAFTSGLILLFFALAITYGAIDRLFHPAEISFNEAIPVAILGLIVNVLSAFLLHHDHDSDQNLHAAYLHVLSDALTSLLAIAGLFAAMWWQLLWIDGVCALIGALVIILWAIRLLAQSGKNLIKK